MNIMMMEESLNGWVSIPSWIVVISVSILCRWAWRGMQLVFEMLVSYQASEGREE